MPTASGRSFRRTPVAATLMAVVVGGGLLGCARHDEFATLKGSQGGAYCLALSPNGADVAAGGGEGDVHIWDVGKRRLKQSLTGHSGRVLAVAWSPDGATLASGGADKSLRLWDPQEGREKQVRSKLPSEVTGVSYSSDARFLAIAMDRVVFYWEQDISLEPRRIRAHAMPISGLACRPGGHELVTFSSDKAVRIWDLDTGNMLAEMPGPTGHCHGLDISSDGKLLACSGGGKVHLFDLEERRPLEAIEPQARTLYGVAFSPDGRTLAVGSEDKVVVIWDVGTKRERARLRGHGYTVGPMAFLPEGNVLITASHDSTLKMWKVE